MRLQACREDLVFDHTSWWDAAEAHYFRLQEELNGSNADKKQAPSKAAARGWLSDILHLGKNTSVIEEKSSTDPAPELGASRNQLQLLHLKRLQSEMNQTSCTYNAAKSLWCRSLRIFRV